MENSKYSILYIAKEEFADSKLTEYFSDSGINCEICDINSDVHELCQIYAESSAELVLINDEGYKAGFIDILKAFVRLSKCSVIVISGKKDSFTEILALELGADDYISRPAVPELVVARVRNVLKRCEKKGNAYEDEVRYPGLIVNISQYKVEIDGNYIKMPPKELELLYLLASNPNIVYTREKLLEVIWGYDLDVGSRTVDVHVKRLRDKIEKSSNPWRIGTVWSVGYRFEIDTQAVSADRDAV
ncbi:MAG: response regulator transcription factor [Clostridia bacterium]|nr:response regulator transcription factor [Clostridia bacterium]